MIPYSYFIHPEDERTMLAMKSIPGFDSFIRKNMSGLEEMVNDENLASQIRLSEKQLPEVYKRVTRICDMLGIKDYPQVFLCMSPYPNAWTYGETTPSITLTSALLEYLKEDELDSVIAHECGHIVCHHVLYNTVAHFLTMGQGNFVSGVTKPLRLAIKHWQRYSELSADRVAVMVVGIDAFVRCEMRLAGGPGSITDRIDVKQYIEQAREYDRHLCHGDGGNVLQDIAVMEESHPFSAVRIIEAIKWKEGDHYKDIRNLSLGTSNICPHCHKPVDNSWTFCRRCGSRLKAKMRARS